MNAKLILLLNLTFGMAAAQAQQQNTPAQTVMDWESAMAQQQYKTAYILGNKDSIGSYETFLNDYGNITSLSFMDMAAPQDNSQNTEETVMASGEFKDSKLGEGKCDFTFHLTKNKKSNNWEITRIILKTDKMTPSNDEETTEPAVQTETAEPAAGAQTE